jgi:hypothetical protein
MLPPGPPRPTFRISKRICRRLTEAEAEELAAGYAAGTTIDKLVEQFQVDPSTVQKHVRQLGLPRRFA